MNFVDNISLVSGAAIIVFELLDDHKCFAFVVFLKTALLILPADLALL